MKYFICTLFLSVVVLLNLQSCSKDPLGEGPSIQEDISAPIKIIAEAGGDMQFSLPLFNFSLNGSATSALNPPNLNLEYEWTCLSYPSSAVSPFIELPGELESRVFHIDAGIYFFQLKVKYQKLLAYDTVKFYINPDPLKGKSIEYDNVTWDWLYFNDYERLGVRLFSTDFIFRDINALNIDFWDDALFLWKPILKNDFFFEKPGQITIFHWDFENWQLVGKKTKIRISFL